MARDDFNHDNLSTVLDVLALLLLAAGAGVLAATFLYFLVGHRLMDIGAGMLITGVVIYLGAWLADRQPKKERT